MAIYYFNMGMISRANKDSAVASAAYRHGRKVKSELTGKTHDYGWKTDVAHAELTLPKDAPDWAVEAYGAAALGRALDGKQATDAVRREAVGALSDKLWHDVEQFEDQNNIHRKKAQFAAKFLFALPVELSREAQLDLARSFVENSLSGRGAITDWVLHEPEPNEAGERNPHIHAMVALRDLGPGDWARKNRIWGQRSLPRALRAEWAREANIALERGGHPERIDPRRLVDQKIDLKPISYDRTLAEALEGRGEELRRKVKAQEALEDNRAYLRDDPDHILNVVSAERTAFSEQDVQDAFLRQGFEKSEAASLTRQAMTSFEMVHLSWTPGDGEMLYTTEAQMLVDANLMVDALEMAGSEISVPQSSAPEPVPEGLDVEQGDAFAEMISPKRLSLVSGYAGTGKTRVIAEAAKVWKARGFEVYGGALSGRATQGLAEIKEMRTASLAAWEARWSRGQLPAHGGFVLFMDEAGMVGSASWDRVQHQVAQMGGKLIAVGDPEQLQPVLDSGAFGRLMGRIGGPVIQTVRRIRSQSEQEATRLFATSAEGARHALDVYRLSGAIQETGTTEEAIAALADAYYASSDLTAGSDPVAGSDLSDPNGPPASTDPNAGGQNGGAGTSSAPLVLPTDDKSRIAIGYSGRDVDALNAAIRVRAIDSGRVDQSREVNYGEIVRTDRKWLLPKRYTVPMLFAPGDRVIFTKPHPALEIAKSSFATITDVRPGEIDLLLDGDAARRVTIDVSAFDHFDYGYAATTHKVQGITVDEAFALAHSWMSRAVSYVMMSRHRDSVRMFVPLERFRKRPFEDCATRDDYLDLDSDEAATRRSPVAGARFDETDHAGRADAVAVDPAEMAVAPVSFEGDPHLLAVMRRNAGLLSSDWADGDPVLGEDERGYGAAPQRVIDDLMVYNSTIRAAQVAEILGRVAPHPDTFVRLFRTAMSHPDLVMLSRDGGAGTGAGIGRVYSTSAQVDLELEALDIGVALALAHNDAALAVPEGDVTSALLKAGLDDTVRAAALYGAQASQIRLITGGSGSGKTAVLTALGVAHAGAGFDVVRLAPTRGGARALAQSSGERVQGLVGFLRGLEDGRVRLDANSVILLDEAGMLNATQARDLFEVVAHSGAKLIAAWDKAQLGAIEAGRVLGDLEARTGSAVLTGQHRQRADQGRDIVCAIRTEPGPVAAARLGEAGVLEAAQGRAAALERLVDGYLQDRRADKVILVNSRADAVEVNAALWTRLHPGMAVPVDLSLGAAAHLHEGDRVRLGTWYAPARLPAGTRGVVVEADAEEVKIRLEGLGDNRFVVVRRDDAEFRTDFGFARTVHEARGQGYASVHVLGAPGMTRAALATAVGLHEETVRIVLPVREGPEGEDQVQQSQADQSQTDQTRGQEMLAGLMSRRGSTGSVAAHVLDPEGSNAQAVEDVRRLRRHVRGAGSAYAPKPTAPAFVVSEADLIANPDLILRVLSAERAFFSIADLRRALGARIDPDAADLDQLVSTALGSQEIVWLKETAPDGAALFTTRANENAVYLRANPAHILTLIGAERTLFTLDDLRTAFERRLPQGGDVDGLVDTIRQNDALVGLEAWGPGGAQLFTTRAHIVTENNLVAQARALEHEQIAPDAALGAGQLSATITGGQRRAGEAMLEGARLTLVRGVAGSGKTTVLREVAQIWRARGFEVCGGALSGRAASELGGGVEGMDVASLAAWEARWAKGWRPSGKGFVFVMDEAAMVGSDVWARVQDRVMRLGGKLIAVGDPAQLQPVSASHAYRAVEAHLGSVVIAKVRRQASAAERAWTEQFAAGGAQAAEAMRGYSDAGHVRFDDTVETAIHEMAKAYFETGAPQDTRIGLAYTRADVGRLNAAIRDEALRRGVVSKGTVRSYGQVQRDGEAAPRDLAFGIGDRVTFAQAHPALGVVKNSFATVMRTDAGGIGLRLDGDDGREIDLDGEDVASLDYGYATTMHKSQGMTVDYALILAHGLMDLHTAYVAMSRHVNGARMFVPRTRIESLDALCTIVQRSHYQSLGARTAKDQTKLRFGADMSTLDASGRSDVISGDGKISTVSFEEDAHLAGVLGRVTGLLGANYSPGDPVFGEDPRGYAKSPHLVIDDLIARQATVRAVDVARALSTVALEPDSFARLFREAMHHPDLIALCEEGEDGEGRVYSTKGQVALELKVMDRAVGLALDRTRRHDMVDGNILRAMIKERKLTREQGDAMRLAASGQRLSIISGRSGSGKTFVANVLADVHRRGGYKVYAVSPTGTGVDNLRAEGAVRAMTLAGLEAAVDKGRITLDARSVILLDEAGLVGAKTADSLLERVEESGAKLIALRDNDQLAPYEAGPVFKTLEARIGSVELGVSHRQGDEKMQIMISQLRSHHLADFAVKNLHDTGILKAGGTPARAIKRLAADYVADRRPDKIALAHSRRDAAALNAAIRAGMDQDMPTRAAFVGGKEKAGTVSALRPGDRIVLTSWYERARLRPGTEAVVERRKNNRVVLRVGSGEEAAFLSFKKDDPAFEYRFAFASTVHGAKGRAAASVHMLASPGMSRGILYTGAALHRDALNIVAPVPKDRVAAAVTAIARTEDTARSALDYGFDATAHARQVLRAQIQAQGGPDRPAPGVLRDGLDRTLDWIADRLDGGQDGVRAPAPTQRRLNGLRDLVMVELMAAWRGADGDRFTPAERKEMEVRIETLISPRGWRRFVGQGWAVRAFEAESERGHIPGVTRQAQMVGRLLKRGMVMADATHEDKVRDWFARAHGAITVEIEAQAKAWAQAQGGGQIIPAQLPSSAAPQPATKPAPVAIPQPTQPVDISVVRNRDYGGMGLQLAQAISERIPMRDPVHDLDLPGALEALVRAADPGERVPIDDAALFARIPQVSYSEKGMADLAALVGKALAKGPPDDLASLRAERAALLGHLEAPRDARFAAKEFVPRLRSFTHVEVHALHSPQIAWPASLPARDDAVRQTISKSFRAYADTFTKDRNMERDDILKGLILGDASPKMISEMRDKFTLDEIMALGDPKRDMPASLPDVGDKIRGMIAATLERAARNEAEGSDGVDQGAITPKTAPEMALEDPLEAPLSPKAAGIRDMALSFSVAISRHVWNFDPVHETDVQKRIRSLLEGAPGARVEGQDPEMIARKIAQERRLNGIRRAILAEMGEADMTDELMYGNKADVFLIAGKDEQEFDQRVNTALGRNPSSKELIPNDYDVAAADLVSRANADPEMAEAIKKALKFGVPESAADVRAARMRHLKILTTQKGLRDQPPETYAKSLFAAFSHKEMEAMFKENEALPETLPKLGEAQRAAISRTLMAVFSRVQSREDPGLQKALALHKEQVRHLGLDQGPSHSPGW